MRTIFAQPDKASAMTQLRKVADGLRTRFTQAAALLEDAAEDILLAEQDDEWSVAERRYFSAKSMTLLTQPRVRPGQEERLAAVS